MNRLPYDHELNVQKRQNEDIKKLREQLHAHHMNAGRFPETYSGPNRRNRDNHGKQKNARSLEDVPHVDQDGKQSRTHPVVSVPCVKPEKERVGHSWKQNCPVDPWKVPHEYPVDVPHVSLSEHGQLPLLRSSHRLLICGFCGRRCANWINWGLQTDTGTQDFIKLTEM